VVEFQYRRLRAEQPLPLLGKAIGMGSAVVLIPGLLVFAWLLSSYRANGYDRMAKEFKLWFLFGVVLWILCILVSVCLTSFGGK